MTRWKAWSWWTARAAWLCLWMSGWPCSSLSEALAALRAVPMLHFCQRLVGRKIAEGTLADKAVLIGTSAPGLQDVRTTPVGPVYPGVEAHASMLTALMDGSTIAIPDYARGFDVLQLLMVGLVLAFGLSVLPAGPALLLSAAVFLALTLLNFWLYRTHGLAMPLATALALVFTATAVNIAHGYLFESRAKRALASRFRSYVPPHWWMRCSSIPSTTACRQTVGNSR